jgi:hypothetical protein
MHMAEASGSVMGLLVRNQDEEHAHDHGRQGDEIFYSHGTDFRVRVLKAPAARRQRSCSRKA